MRYHNMLFRIYKIQKPENKKSVARVQSNRNLYSIANENNGVVDDTFTVYCKTYHISGNHTLKYISSDMKTYVYTKTYILMFIVSLYITAMKWKKLQCPL